MQSLRQPDRASDAPLPPGHGAALALLALIGRPVWIYDVDRARMTWANPAGLAFWGADSVEALCARDFNPEGRGTAARLENLRRALERGESRDERWTFYPGGQPAMRDCRLSGVRLADGRTGLLVDAGESTAAAGDFTYELRAIEAVRQSPLMISLMSEGGHWLMHNPAAEALMARLGLVNIPNYDNYLALFAVPDQARRLRAKAIAKGHAQATLRLGGKALRMHDVLMRAVRDPVSGRLSLMISQQDVTRSHRLEQRLHKALARERAVTETQRLFLSVTSHDFRTPLTIIDGAARRIGRLAERGSAIAERAETIRATARRMVEAVDRTLGWASIAEGKVAFRPEPADLRALAAKALEGQRALHPDRVFTAAFGDVPLLNLDAGLIERSLDNLLSNAVKYSPPGEPVDLRCARRGRRVELSVSDHGIGVPQADVKRLFTRFFRAANTKGTKGTGIGLNAVKFYTEMHGGKVSVRSVEGEGATFTLSFPVG
ncbi:MAG: ATP-binding protein [Novosphingobium sp.]